MIARPSEQEGGCNVQAGSRPGLRAEERERVTVLQVKWITYKKYQQYLNYF